MPLVFSKPTPLTDAADVDSSSLAKLAYDTQRAILQVEFRDGSVYQYLGVPPQTYQDLLRADSKGAYFNRHIRSPFPHAFIRATPTADNPGSAVLGVPLG
jgi:KTSC domain